MVKRRKTWIAANGVVAVLFQAFSSTQWLEPEVRDIPGASGGAPFVFMSAVIALLVPLLLLNLVWLLVVISGAKTKEDWLAPSVTFGLMGVFWLVLIRFNANMIA